METPTLSRGRAWALAIAATLTMAVSYADRQTFAVLAPTVTAALGISEQQYGYLGSAFSIAYLIGAPLSGRLIDRVGARRGLFGAVLVWSAVAALHAVVPGFGVLFALRIALGFAEAPSFPGAAQTVHRALPPAERARGFGVLFTGSSLGAMVSIPLATWLNSAYGFRAAFLVSAIIGLCWVPMWIALAFHPSAKRALEVRPPEARPAPGGARPSAVVFHPAVLRALAVVFASSPLIAFVLLWGSKYLVRDQHITQAEVGHYLWLPPLLFDVGALLFGHLASRRDKRRNDGSPPRLLLAVAAALCVSAVTAPLARGPWEATAIAGAALAGGGALFALLTSDMLSRVPPAAVSTAGGITAAAQSLAYIVANPLIGRWVEQSGSYSSSLVALGLWVLPGCVVWLLWTPPPRVSAAAI